MSLRCFVRRLYSRPFASTIIISSNRGRKWTTPPQTFREIHRWKTPSILRVYNFRITYFPLDEDTFNSVPYSPLRDSTAISVLLVKWPSLVRDARSIASAPAHASTVAVIYVYKRRRIRKYKFERLHRYTLDMRRQAIRHLRIKRRTGPIFSFALSIGREEEKFRSLSSDTRKIRGIDPRIDR